MSKDTVCGSCGGTEADNVSGFAGACDMCEGTGVVLGKDAWEARRDMHRNWVSYVSAEVTRAKIDERRYLDYCKVMEAALILIYREGGVAATLAKQYAVVDARLCRVRKTLRRYEDVYRTASDRYDRYERLQRKRDHAKWLEDVNAE